jgi:hypothetical protein
MQIIIIDLEKIHPNHLRVGFGSHLHLSSGIILLTILATLQAVGIRQGMMMDATMIVACRCDDRHYGDHRYDDRRYDDRRQHDHYGDNFRPGIKHGVNIRFLFRGALTSISYRRHALAWICVLWHGFPIQCVLWCRFDNF